MAVDHEFGAQHTELKLSIVESYLKVFTKALKPRFRQLWYIDAFAGTGSRTVRVEARDGDLFDAPVPEYVEQRRGSAQIAIDVVPRFDRLIFMDTKPAHCAALRELADRHYDRDIVVVEDDANRAIPSITRDGLKNIRAVMFLDPYGMDVEWATLAAIAATKAIDVCFSFRCLGSIAKQLGEAATLIRRSEPRSIASLALTLGSGRSIPTFRRRICSAHRTDSVLLTSEASRAM
jgi:three-Cys-motif partner protein